MTRSILMALCLGMAGAASAAVRLTVIAGAANYDAQGFVRIAGEIRNDGPEPVCAPGVAIGLADAAGKALSVKSVVTIAQQELGRSPRDGVLAARSWVLPGESVPYTYRRDRNKIAGAPAGHQVVAVGRSCGETPPKLLIENLQFGPDKVASFLRVSGLVHNLGKTACRNANLAIGFYDTAGRLIVAESTSGVDPEFTDLPAGSGTAFQRRSLPVPDGQTVAAVKVWGNCRL